ncbi:MAG: tRNA adenosine(34) deaminase TadA [Collinsella sp.]|nr:tRNA adenosine(34) deaminase TadA [Collinsella sp.]
MRETDERFMREALAEARAAAALGEVPIGAVVVHEGEVIARAHNRRELDGDPSAHAEFSALVDAARVLGRWRLTGCTVYVTLEPCAMCAGLMVNARIDRCVYGAADPKAGAVGSLLRLHDDARLNHRFPVTAGVLEAACADELTRFFRARRGERPRGAAGDDAHEGARADAAACGCEGAHGAADAGEASPRPLRVLVAVDSFKGSATSAEAAAWIAEGIRDAAPGAKITCLPVADGGEGLLEAMHAAIGGTIVAAGATGPLGEPIAGRYLRSDGIAVVEAAVAAGHGLTDGSDTQARAASSFGVGELVRAAIEGGVQTVYVGLGGTCTSDGGAGFLRALGGRIEDAEGGPVRPGLTGVGEAARVDLGPVTEALAGVELVALADVRSPLVGKAGALAVFGAQKGLADPMAHDGDMVRFARLLDGARPAAVGAAGPQRFRSVVGVPGAGAAGGLGAALLAVGARLESGAEAVLDAAGFNDAARQADLVITGEGHLDTQTAAGKVVAAVARRSRRLGVPTAAVVGGRSADLSGAYREGVDLVVAAPREPMPLARALDPAEARINLRCAGETVARAFFLRP